jgi:type II secretory pathway pseudopilin PulG
MTRAQLQRRIRARARDERGFTIVESVLAITVIFAGLTAMAYTATIGFQKIALSRQRVKATAFAGQVMEELRGLAYADITRGIPTEELSTDPNVVSCSGTYRLESCSGEAIVSSTGLDPTDWLVPHTGTTDVDGLSLDWSTYVTNDDPTTNPYRVTVVVSWTGAGTAGDSALRVQSLFWSPEGCVSSVTHPFAAPCQPYFYGQSLVPLSLVSIDGSVGALDFSAGALKAHGATATVATEQVTNVDATFTHSGVEMTDTSDVTTTSGASAVTTSASDDPGGASSTYETSSQTDGSNSLYVDDLGDPTLNVTLSSPSGGTGRADSAVAATSSSDVCPPPTDTAENDSLPCGGSRVQLSGTLTATTRLDQLASGLGSATLARFGSTTSNPNKAFVDREDVSGTDGRIEVTTTRRLGTINLCGLPSSFSSPTGWSGSNPWNGYFATLYSYQDTVTAQAGISTSAPTATVNAGTVYYYNGSGYTSLSATSSSLDSLDVTRTFSVTISGSTVTVTCRIRDFSRAATVTSYVDDGSSRLEAEGEVTPVIGTLDYTVAVDGVIEVDLELTLDLGDVAARAVYEPPPSAG